MASVMLRNATITMCGLLALACGRVDGEAKPGHPTAVTSSTPRGPDVVTESWMRQLVSDEVSAEVLIDAAAGAILVEFDSGGGVDEPVETMKITKLCGDQIGKELARAVRVAKENLEDDDELACTNEPTPRCTVEGLPEYAISAELYFHPSTKDSGARIAVIGLVERSIRNDEWHEQADAMIKRALTTSPDCQPSPG